ncbi:5-(carboxyamino)imidazole ribonucleotide synthase [Vallitalea guaymasensis]|uniref:N5-carboxyaminoimidazole ribonucleotide synthase n=1 Tax=Vallitalea guaymasensis TaxID=1185412 RepID=A0A8J8MCT3_9FIRM|nr:5-(carboxyamino)imidazole ribonucleotide synthase [Vallitalea guaymasensis]QUH30513.1 5-(carboxyamino)imidazole ribonucleotide synthase [Vallitalea guaymasensis]
MNNLSKKIGIIGGGQLGKMMILDAKRLGFYVITLDPSESCPSHSISDEHILASFDDEKAIRTMAEKVDVITYEFEHINVDILKKLEDEGYTIYPTAKSLEIIQNKYNQKYTLLKNDIAVPDFMLVQSTEDLINAGQKFGYPMMLKTCTGGYDGKGNYVVENEKLIEESYRQLGNGTIPLMVERFVDLKKEISVLACRGINGEITVYPVGENIHVDSILDETRVPADISKKCTEEAMELAHRVMEIFSGVGMFCVEMFVTKDDNILINEVAPRPHNSGHYTIEGCLTSQFEQHIRAITGLPLGDVSLRCPTVMRNLLGEDGESGIAYYEGLDKVYNDGIAKVHIYGKEEVRPKRKMGHITVCADTIDEAVEKAEKAKRGLRVISQKG